MRFEDRALFRTKQYTLPEDADPWGGSALLNGDDADEVLDEDDDDLFTDATGLPPGMPTGQQMPTPDQLRSMMQMLRSDPQAREQFMQAMSVQTGLPPMMVQMLMGNMENALSGMSDAQMNELPQMGTPFGDEKNEEEEEDEDEEATGDVHMTTLGSLNLRKGQNFLYLFDYGDEWRFNVKLHAINENGDPNAEYPKIVESVGTAPEQYPDWEEEEALEDEEQ